jgi:hypothetical protein
LRVAPLPELTWTADIDELGVWRITEASWSESAVAAPRAQRPPLATRLLRGDRRPVHHGPPTTAPDLADIGVTVGRRDGIWLSNDSRLCLEDTSADLAVQIRGVDNDPNVRRALAAASPDLYWLETDPEEEGSIDNPGLVSDIDRDHRGYFVRIATGDTPPELLRRIPVIVQRHLRAHGVTAAEIAIFDPTVS